MSAENPDAFLEDPDYERVYDEDDTVEVRRGDLRAVLDVATMSLDFGSGFLDSEQVVVLRRLAEIVGIDPRVATPANFVCQYYGHTWTRHDKPINDGTRLDYWPDFARGHKTYWGCAFCHEHTVEQPEAT